MDELRYGRLENRVDEIRDDLAEVKAESKVQSNTNIEMKDAIKDLAQIMTTHVAGDEKIISEIHPIIKEFQFQQERKKRKEEAWKAWGLKLRIPATIIGIIATALTVWTSF